MSNTATRNHIEECLKSSKRLTLFKDYRMWYFYAFSARGKKHEEATELAWQWSLRLFPDWEETNPKKVVKPEVPRPTREAIKQLAARAGFLFGPSTEKNMAEYKRLRAKFGLEYCEPKFIKRQRVDGPMDIPFPNMDGTDMDPDMFKDKPPCNVIDEIEWARQNLDHTGADLCDAPSMGAWSMLKWARENPAEFFKSVVTKTLPTRGQLDREYTNRDQGEVQLEFVERLRKIAQESKLEHV